MAETVTCRPEELGKVLADDFEDHVETQRKRLTRGLSYIQERIVAEAPRFRGDFVESIQPYIGEPGSTWQRGGAGHEAGASDVEAVMQDWTPGQEVGIATDAPYSRKLIFHAGDKSGQAFERNDRRRRQRAGQAKRTYTKKVGSGWVERIVHEGNRIMESEE